MDIAVVGLGLVGNLVALNLLQAQRKSKYKVTIFTPPPAQSISCAKVSAAMLAPFAELETAEALIFELGFESFPLWHEILAELKEPNLYQNNGSLCVAHHQDKTELARMVAQIQSQLKSIATHSEYKLSMLDAEKIKQLEPELTNFNSAVFFPEDAHLSNNKFLQASHKYLTANADSIEHAHITEIKDNCIVADNIKKSFDLVFDCRGLGAKTDIKNLRGVRGEIIRVHAPDVKLSRPVRLMHPKYKLYIVPRENNEYVIGASQIESADTSPVSVRSCLELLSAAYSIHSGFAEARITSMQSNAPRPALLDNNPKIFYNSKLIRINGLYRHGFLTGPAIVARAMQLLNPSFCPNDSQDAIDKKIFSKIS